MHTHFGRGLAICALLCCGLMRTPGQPEVVGTEPVKVVAPAPEKPTANELFQLALQLQAQGKEREALLKFLLIPGAEYMAARIARAKTEQYRTVLMVYDGFTPGSLTVVGDFHLALGEKDEALKCYRTATDLLARTESYPVEPPNAPNNPYANYLALPFQLGPGSQRDNWLIRRFIALEAWEDAGKEFARIWRVHQLDAAPFAVNIGERTLLYLPADFTGKGLQFAIDYAYFLKRQKQPEQALTVLLEPALRMDMDRNPNTEPRQEPFVPVGRKYPARDAAVLTRYSPWRGFSAGVSRKEYLRLAYGEFKAQGQEARLITTVQKQIDGGDNRARRVLARIRLHQGQPEQALELDYINNADFDPLSAAVRRGMVYEDAQKLPEAVDEYEKALALPYVPPNLPDKDEETVQRQMQRSIRLAPDPNNLLEKAAFQTDILNRLQRLYAALGKTPEALQTTLRQFDLHETLLRDFNLLEGTARRFQSVGQSPRFVTWVKERAAVVQDPTARVNLCWIVGEPDGAVTALAELAKDPKVNASTFEPWKERFCALGTAPFRALLTALTAANPKDARSRLELLDLEDRFAGPEVIQALEMLLNDTEHNAFRPSYKGGRNRTQFRDYFDLAYRLLRLYEKSDQLDKLQALALRIARGDKPFGLPDPEQHAYRNANGLLEDANACLALAVARADSAAKQDALAAALPPAPLWDGARAQLARRRAGKWVLVNAAPAGWSNAPAGVKLLASDQNALSLCSDGFLVYAGMPWGVAVYDSKGILLTRVALDAPVTDMAIGSGKVWLGTPNGLFCIGLPTVTAIGDVRPPTFMPDRVNTGEPFDVLALAANGDLLWISTSRDVRVYNVKTNKMRIFSTEELGQGDRHGRYTRFLFDGPYVWADGNDTGCRRYDTRTKKWSAPVGPSSRQSVGLIGVIDGQVWGHAWFNDELRDRPCIIDRETLKVTPVLLAETTDANRSINGPFSYFGRCNGKPVFGDDHPDFYYDAEIGKLRRLAAPDGKQPVINSDIPTGLMSGTHWWKSDGVLRCDDGVIHRHTVFGQPFHARSWSLLKLADGTRVLAGTHSGDTWYQNSRDDMPEDSGGVRFISPDGTMRTVSAGWRPDILLGEEVYSSLAEGDRRWLCTSHGLVVLDRLGQVTARFTRRDGLCANTVMNGVALGDKLYFATRWGDDGGGLAIFDPKTATFTSLTEADGLAANSLQAVAVEGDAIKLIYGIQYRRYLPDSDYRCYQYPSGLYRPATGEISPPGKPEMMSRRDADTLRPRPGEESLPYLGGTLFASEAIDGQTYLYGSRGLVILNGGAQPVMRVPEITARVETDPRLALLADAEKRRIVARSPAELAAALKDDNPYYRANALASVYREPERLADEGYLPLIAGQLDDPEPRVRSTALYLLTQLNNDQTVLPLLRKRLDDSDEYIGALATVELAKRGEMPDITRLREIMRKSRQEVYSNFPFGAASSMGVQVDGEHVYRALAPHATPEIFRLLLEYPITETSGFAKTVFPQLGTKLRASPAAAEMLLAAYGRDQVRFAQAVFKYAGKDMLPMLRTALTSDNRIVRSNAARACGSIGDPSAIPHLIAALDMESGLARASIVWALGELKAREALPRMITLYVDAQNDEKRRQGGGFMAAQSGADIGAQYETMSNLDAVGSEWDELKAIAARPTVDVASEELLTPALVLEAVRKIGPAFAQEFYRALAGEKDAAARCEAAVQLLAAPEEELGKILPILYNLLTDTDTSVRMAAAVSKVLLDNKAPLPIDPFSVYARRCILEWLMSSNRWERRAILMQLTRVSPNLLSFARKAITAIADSPFEEEENQRLAKSLLS